MRILWLYGLFLAGLGARLWAQDAVSPPPYPRYGGPEWLQTAVFYQIYPQSYRDSNGDGIGDLPGIISRLDYIASLGVDAIWLNPVYPSPFRDAGYDVADYRAIAPRYGTLADMRRLIAEAQARDIRIVMDLVAGHTSIDHPWFQASAQADDGPLSDRYIWTDHRDSLPKGFVTAEYPREGNYLKNFFDSQPALNYGYGQPNPAHPWEQPVDAAGPQATRQALKDIMAYWMDLGVAGFRVDMAHSLVKSDPDQEETYRLWTDLRQWFKGQWPEGVLMAEWGRPEQAIRAGFDIDFMLHFGVKGYPSLFFNQTGTFRRDTCFFERRGAGSVAAFWENYQEQKRRIGYQGYLSLPTANHDFQRPAAGPERQRADLKVIMAFLLTWPGVPVIYYGDEIGLRFLDSLPDKEGSKLGPKPTAPNRAGTRTPMQWGTGPNAGFSTAAAEQLYLPIDPSPDRPTVAQAEADSASLLHFVRDLIALRKAHPALGNGGRIEALLAEADTYPFVYLREAGDEAFVIAINPAAEAKQVRLPLPPHLQLAPLRVQGATFTVEAHHQFLHMDGVSYGIFRVKR
jgi:maltose alpha-D-glucosyltransferase/alpha-amylase